MLGLYKHTNGNYYRLVKIRQSGFNTFIDVDQRNNAIIEKRKWSAIAQEQPRLIRGFENLILIKN